jgi:4-aminobutyrate aminotransferase-like enzyme
MGDPARVILFRAIIEEIERLNLVEHTARVGEYLYAELVRLRERFPNEIMNLRGKGQGTFIAWDSPRRDEVLKKAKRVGINIGGSGAKGVRLRPMLVFQRHHGEFHYLMVMMHLLLTFVFCSGYSSGWTGEGIQIMRRSLVSVYRIGSNFV